MAIIEMDLDYKFGPMVQNMKEIGKITKLMEKENFGILMEIIMMVNGKITKLTDLEFIYIQMVPNIKANGKMIYSMVKELKLGTFIKL